RAPGWSQRHARRFRVVGIEASAAFRCPTEQRMAATRALKHPARGHETRIAVQAYSAQRDMHGRKKTLGLPLDADRPKQSTAGDSEADRSRCTLQKVKNRERDHD